MMSFVVNANTAQRDVYPLDAVELSWLHRGPNRRYIGVACRLPDCPTLVARPVSQLEQKRPLLAPTPTVETRRRRTVRGKRGRRQWFCSDEHADQYRSRRRSLDTAISRLDSMLAGANRSKSGQYTTEAFRSLDRDRTYLTGLRRTYEAI